MSIVLHWIIMTMKNMNHMILNKVLPNNPDFLPAKKLLIKLKG